MKRLRLIVLIVQRVLITVAVFFAAVLTIHFTGIDPKERSLPCDRVCNRADWPRICRFELVVEKRTMRHDRVRHLNLGMIHDNVTLVGTERKELQELLLLDSDAVAHYYTVNGRYVGPTLTVCENDYVVVDVENRIPGESIALHWTGQTQHKTPFMDGVPMITQCPIASFARFRYKFQADTAGTHLYHGFAGSERTAGLLGALVVRPFPEFRQNVTGLSPAAFLSDQVWLVTELDGLVAINGRRNWRQTLPSHGALRGEHRIRLLYAGSSTCPYLLDVADHELRLIALDGISLEESELLGPTVDRILLHDGLRADLALSRVGGIKSDYEIRLTPVAENDASRCGEPAFFCLRYESPGPAPQEDEQPRLQRAACVDDGIKYNSLRPPPAKGEDQASRRTLDLVGGICQSERGVVCLQDVQGSRERFPKELRSYDTRLEFTINSREVITEGPFGEAQREMVQSVNGFTFAFPSAMMLREPASAEVRAHTCSHRRLPRSCHPMMARCECVHVEHLEAGHRVEMVLINADPSQDYVYHLHGHSVFVVGIADGHRTDPGKPARNLQRPPERDTIVVRRDSIVVVRFVAKSAGLWLLRDIGSPGWSRGLDVVLNVARTHGPDYDIPSDFPVCRHFVGPRYFLI